MAEALPVVCIFGVLNITLHSIRAVPDFEDTRLDCRCYLTDDNLYKIFAKDRPVVILSFGDPTDFPNLMNAPFEMRRRWINLVSTEDLSGAGMAAFTCFLQNAASDLPSKLPLVTVFTPTYKTGERIMRPFDSLRAQRYSNWEWVILDDSDDDGSTFSMLSELAETDNRIRVYKQHQHSGVIGKLKKDACLLGRGDFLVELDHDDELTEKGLSCVVSAFRAKKDCGFVYTDFAECFEDGSPVTYGKDISKKPPYADWGQGYGSYREEIHGGQKYMVVNAPNINAKTIRHIVAAPNHIRAWRKETYLEIGGHSDFMHVADDYELMVRTFLHTKMCRVPEMCYVQYRNYQVGNTHQSRNKEIQRLVRYMSQLYDARIHARLLELGVDDFVWGDCLDTFTRMGQVKNPPIESHCTVTYEC